MRTICNRNRQEHSKVREIIKSDCRCTIRDIAKAVSISLLREHCILKRTLKVQKISGKQKPHLLAVGQKEHAYQSNCINVFKVHPKAICNFVTGDKT